MQAIGDPPPHEAGSAGQSLAYALQTFVVHPVHGEKGLGLAQIAGHAHEGEGDDAGVAHARILDLLAHDDLAKNLPDFAGYAFCPLGHRRLNPRSFVVQTRRRKSEFRARRW